MISPWMRDSNALHNLRSLHPNFFDRRQGIATVQILPFPYVYIFMSSVQQSEIGTA